MPVSIESNRRPSNRSGVCTVLPASRSSSANATSPGVSPWAWWNRRTAAIRLNLPDGNDAVQASRDLYCALRARSAATIPLFHGIQPAVLLDAPAWTVCDVPVPRGYFGALAVEGEAASVRVLPWSPLHGVTRGHQARTARR